MFSAVAMLLGCDELTLALGEIEISTNKAGDSKPKVQQHSSWQQFSPLLSICMVCITACWFDKLVSSALSSADNVACSCAQGICATKYASDACENSKQIIKMKLATVLNTENLQSQYVVKRSLRNLIKNSKSTFRFVNYT